MEDHGGPFYIFQYLKIAELLEGVCIFL